MTSDQLFLKFSDDKNQDFAQEDFIIHQENQQAFEFLQKFFAQKISDENLTLRAILKGEKYCGKSHLLNIFAKKNNAKIIDCKSLKKSDFAGFFIKGEFYILENIDEICDDNLLFHILNLSYENQSFLMMSAKNLDVFSLKDLISRIKNIYVCQIKNPEVDSIKILIFKILSQKQLTISDHLVDFLSKNCKRNYEEIFILVEKIEKFCFENKKSPNVKDVQNWL